MAQQSARVSNDLIALQSSNTQRDQTSFSSKPQRELPILINFANEIEREPEQEPPDVTAMQAALRKCHCRMNHMPFS